MAKKRNNKYNKHPIVDYDKKIKYCTKCTVWLSFHEFTKDKHHPTGLTSKCKACQKQVRLERVEYNKAYVRTEKYKKYQKEYDKTKRIRTEKDKETRRLRERKYFKHNSLFKLKQNCSRHIRFHLMKGKKQKRTIEYLGCSIQELKIHLEKQFREGMTWENYGQKGWEIDHIIPCSSAHNEDELLKLFHYTNLQPLWATENRQKSDKYVRID